MTTEWIGVKPETKERLAQLRKDMGFTSYNNLIVYLIDNFPIKNLEREQPNVLQKMLLHYHEKEASP